MKKNCQRRGLAHWIPRTTAVLTMIAMVFPGSLATLAASGATIEGTVETPGDPSRVGDVTSVRIRPDSGGPAATMAVEPVTGKFLGSGMAAGEYELVAIGADGKPLSPEPKKMLLVDGVNKVILSMQPPVPTEQDSDGDGVADADDSCPNTPPGTAVGADGCPSEVRGKKRPGAKQGLKDWQLTLIYLGVVGAVIIALDDDDDDEQPASPF